MKHGSREMAKEDEIELNNKDKEDSEKMRRLLEAAKKKIEEDKKDK
jgi:hypothetical protein